MSDESSSRVQTANEHGSGTHGTPAAPPPPMRWVLLAVALVAVAIWLAR